MIAFLVAIIVILVIIALAIAYSSFSWGVVTYCFYNWFIAPVYDIPELTLIQAIGLGFFIGLFHNRAIYKKSKDSDGSDNTNDILTFTLIPWITLLIGWIYWTIFM